jgi:RNA-binding protein NOB1
MDLENQYRALVVDSGPFIRQSSLALREKAQSYYTVPAVVAEIRDAKARQYLEQLPYELVIREPSPQAIKVVTDFSRQTGDYQSLSAVDLQVLALLYELEQEGCGVDHVRKTPKSMVGIGRVQALTKSKKDGDEEKQTEGKSTIEYTSATVFEADAVDIVDEDEDDDEDDDDEDEDEGKQDERKEPPRTWAMLVNPAIASRPTVSIEEQTLLLPFSQMKLSNTQGEEDSHRGGQFSDADDDDFPLDLVHDSKDEEESDDDGYADSDKQISDEECDVYILDPDEVEQRKQRIQEELQSDFPSLAASLQVPYEGNSGDEVGGHASAPITKELAEKLKEEALKPVSKSGKLYNSFRKYRNIINPKQPGDTRADNEDSEAEDAEMVQQQQSVEVRAHFSEEPVATEANNGQSRIMGGSIMSGQGHQVEDDGEGWISSSRDIQKMKAVGKLNPTTKPSALRDGTGSSKTTSGPPIHQRAACATTDFAMQNVILQMNLELMSVDGIKITKLKSWVSRCGACFTVFTDSDTNGPYKAKRLFCSRCGSDMIQRVAASVDGKTGRLRLHLSKKYKNNRRGTKFSLPKPGSNNRFQGDLLLREDQLMIGAWNEKVKKASGGRGQGAAQSIFGSDLATHVGCNAKVVHVDDIRVGFGRRNPNSAKGGRERRGKKKKSGDKACGLRRY